jgi:hypothetical protein
VADDENEKEVADERGPEKVIVEAGKQENRHREEEEEEEEESREEGGGGEDRGSTRRGRKRSLSDEEPEGTSPSRSYVTKKIVSHSANSCCLKTKLTKFSKRGPDASHKVEEILATLSWPLRSEALKVRSLLLLHLCPSHHSSGAKRNCERSFGGDSRKVAPLQASEASKSKERRGSNTILQGVAGAFLDMQRAMQAHGKGGTLLGSSTLGSRSRKYGHHVRDLAKIDCLNQPFQVLRVVAILGPVISKSRSAFTSAFT